MVTSPTGKGVIVMGGEESGMKSKAMFELLFESVEWISKLHFVEESPWEWTTMEQTLQIDHWAPLAIPITDEFISKHKYYKKHQDYKKYKNSKIQQLSKQD